LGGENLEQICLKNSIIASNLNIMKICNKRLILHFAFCFFYFSSIAQKDKISYKRFTVELKKKFIKKALSEKHFFSFLDERGDTTKMGFFFDTEGIFYFQFPDIASTYLSNKINRLSTKIRYTDTVYLKIKRLWISEEKKSSNLARSILLSTVYTMGNCRVICDVFKKIGTDKFLICEYDSSISKRGYLSSTSDLLMGRSISNLIETINSIADLPTTISLKNKIIESNNLNTLPLILTDSKINDGFYLTYDDFLNNKPIDIPFVVFGTQSDRFLKLKQSKEDDSVYTEKCWGYCKDGVPNLRIEKSFYQLFRSQNTFETFINKPINVKYNKLANAFWAGVSIGTSLASSLPITAISNIPTEKISNIVLRTGLYKLDVQTGEIY
jgi:hypothetical protein